MVRNKKYLVLGGQVGGKMDRWMDGWVGGWLDGWMDGWRDDRHGSCPCGFFSFVTQTMT